MKDGGKRKRNIEKAAEDDVGGKKDALYSSVFYWTTIVMFYCNLIVFDVSSLSFFPFLYIQTEELLLARRRRSQKSNENKTPLKKCAHLFYSFKEY